jgi:hypothetical protein
LFRTQKCFDEFIFTADRHARKFLEPLASRYFGSCGWLIGEQSKLIGRNLSGYDAVKQMIEERWWQTMAQNPRHGYSP